MKYYHALFIEFNGVSIYSRYDKRFFFKIIYFSYISLLVGTKVVCKLIILSMYYAAAALCPTINPFESKSCSLIVVIESSEFGDNKHTLTSNLLNLSCELLQPAKIEFM